MGESGALLAKPWILNASALANPAAGGATLGMAPGIHLSDKETLACWRTLLPHGPILIKKLILPVFSGLLLSAGSALAVPRAAAPTPDHSSTLGLLVVACAGLLFSTLRLKRKACPSR